MPLYNPKTQDQWRRIFGTNLPKGMAFESTEIEGTNMYYYANAYALVFSHFDKWLSEQIESLRITENSSWLNEYWDKYGIGKYISKPSSLSDQVTIIKAFASARKGLFTAEQFEQFFQDVFGVAIEIELASAAQFTFEYDFPITFYADTDINWTVIVRIQTSETEDTGFEYLFDSVFYPVDERKESIKALIEELIDINFRIVFEEF